MSLPVSHCQQGCCLVWWCWSHRYVCGTTGVTPPLPPGWTVVDVRLLGIPACAALPPLPYIVVQWEMAAMLVCSVYAQEWSMPDKASSTTLSSEVVQCYFAGQSGRRRLVAMALLTTTRQPAHLSSLLLNCSCHSRKTPVCSCRQHYQGDLQWYPGDH